MKLAVPFTLMGCLLTACNEPPNCYQPPPRVTTLEEDYPARVEFVETDQGWDEFVYSAGKPVEPCADILKWKDSHMPRGYTAQLHFGGDRTTHHFKTLAQAEGFVKSAGCLR